MPDFVSIKPQTVQCVPKNPDKCEVEQTCSGNDSEYSKDPKVWGPILWKYLHTSSINFPQNPSPQQINGMKQMLCNLQWSIPCENCSMHFGKYIEKHRQNMDKICSNRDSLFAFIVDAHNQVNKRYGKKVLSVEEARKLYPILN